MRIAFIVDQFPALSETFILGQITGLIDRGHQVDIFSDRPGNMAKMHPEVKKYQLLENTYCNVIPKNSIWRYIKGIFLLLVSFWQAPQTIIKTLNFLNLRRSLYGEFAAWLKPLYLTIPFLNQPAYDIIHCHYGRNGLKAILLKDLGVINGKIIVAFHGNDISRYLQIHGDGVYDHLFEQADLLQPISLHWQEKLISLGCNKSKVEVHPMGIDCDKFIPTEEEDNHPEKIFIVSVARLVEKKGLSYGIQAVANLLNKYPQLQLQYSIIGDGILKVELEQQIKQLQLSSQVQLLGSREQQEVKEIIAQADIILAPSVTSQNGDSEGIPVSLMEAMAQGLPVISSYHSGIPELVTDGITGYLAQEKDIAGLSSKLDNLVNNPQLRQQMGLAGRQKVLTDYNIKVLCDRLTTIYQQLGC